MLTQLMEERVTSGATEDVSHTPHYLSITTTGKVNGEPRRLCNKSLGCVEIHLDMKQPAARHLIRRRLANPEPVTQMSGAAFSKATNFSPYGTVMLNFLFFKTPNILECILDSKNNFRT